MNDVPMKRCNKCGEEKPATTEFFYQFPSDNYRFSNPCKICRRNEGRKQKTDYDYVTARQLARNTGQNHHDILVAIHNGSLLATDIGTGKKKAWAISLDNAKAYSHLMGWEYITGVTPSDVNHNESIAIKSTIGTPNQCGACGTKNSHIFGDVNADTQEKYGYLCGKCLKLVRDFQGDPKRIRNVLSYVERTRKTEVRINKKMPTALVL